MHGQSTLLVAVALLATFLPAAYAVVPSTLAQTTIPFNSSFKTGSSDIALDAFSSTNLSNIVSQQAHVTYVNESAVLITWVTGDGSTYVGGAVPANNTVRGGNIHTTLVLQQPSSNSMVQQQLFKSEPYYYVYEAPTTANIAGIQNYVSGTVNTMLLTGLTPGQQYSYSIVQTSTGRVERSNLTFTMPPPVGTPSMRFVLVGDLGQTTNSSDTIMHIAEEDKDMIVLVGDLSYADEYQVNGTQGRNPAIPHGAYQPRWDTWGRLMEILNDTPFMYNNGNHELETQPDNASFVSYLARYPNKGSLTYPNALYNQLNASTGGFAPLDIGTDAQETPLYYSTDAGLVHWIHLTSYTSFWPGSNQYQWLVNDLASVNRTVTPWVIVTFHSPWYTSYIGGYQVAECMRQSMEPVLFAGGVDLVFNGHTHAYERTQPVYNAQVNTCGAAHITIGDGGNVEGLVTHFVDQPGRCEEKDATKPNSSYQPQRCSSNWGPNGNYCPTSQPAYSAFREPSFGYGVLEVYNETTAVWQWRNNEEPNTRVADEVWYVRNTSDECAQQRASVLAAGL